MVFQNLEAQVLLLRGHTNSHHKGHISSNTLSNEEGVHRGTHPHMNHLKGIKAAANEIWCRGTIPTTILGAQIPQ